MVKDAKELFIDDGEVNYAKIRGSIVKFSKEVDEIESIGDNELVSDQYLEYDRYMRDNLKNWTFFTTRIETRSDEYRNCRDLFDDFLMDNTEVLSRLKEKTILKEEQEETEEESSGEWEDWGDAPEVEEKEVDEIKAYDIVDEEDVEEYNKKKKEDEEQEDEDDDELEFNNDTSTPNLNKFTEDKIDEEYKKKSKGKQKEDKDNIEKLDTEDIRNNILHGNIWNKLDEYPSNSVDCVITSPPYWNLRDYGEDADEAEIDGWYGQLGNENYPNKYVDNITKIMDKIQRVLKPQGSAFLNIGDSYSDSDYKSGKSRSLLMMPERVYIKMIERGWILRNRIIWIKQYLDYKNEELKGAAVPTSEKNRINHNTWEPMFWFVNSKDYYSDVNKVRVKSKTDPGELSSGKYEKDEIDSEQASSIGARVTRDDYELKYHGLGSNIADAWKIPISSSKESHLATFSEELVMNPMDLACPEKVCGKCGKPYERTSVGDNPMSECKDLMETKIVQVCNCNSEAKSGIVMDPFMGRGTTAKVATDKGFDYTGVEIEKDNIEIIEDYVPETKQVKL